MMIVQCKKCETKFKFDEFLIEGEGVWVRCSRCKNVFFLDDPDIGGDLLPSFVETDKEDTHLLIQEETREPAKSVVKQNFLEQPKLFMDKNDMDLHIDAEKGNNELDMPYLQDDVAKAQGKKGDSISDVKLKPARSRGKKWIFLFIFLLLIGGFLCFFTEIGNHYAKQISFRFWTVVDKIQGKNPKGDDVGPAQVELADIRQRIVSDAPLGIIRIIEGTAINQSSHPMSRIKIKGEITDKGGIVLGVKESYCGNILTGDELTTLTDEQIQNKLSNPQGSNVSNDQIAPKRRIPFMIVFTREPPGVVKTFVVPAGAERLLP
jgi:predicted Zn finger-like uncharacterized protein